MLKVLVLSGPPGVGKSIHIMLRMLNNPGRYLFATSRVDLIDQWYGYLTDRRPLQKQLRLVKIHNDPKCKVSVRRRIEDAATDYAADDHVIVLITHEAMMSMDLSGFAGWHIYIDEIPAATASGSPRAPASAIFLKETYDLKPDASGWSSVEIKSDALNQINIMNDDIMKGLADFDKRVRGSHRVLVDLQDWDQIVGGNRRLNWTSVWTPMQLQAFESVTIASAGYFHSLSYKAASALHPNVISFEEVVIPSPERARPRFLIHYFTEKHTGATTFWKTEEGREALLKIERYLADKPIGYWTANNEIAPFLRLPGQRLTPRQEGSNAFRHHTSCAMIYSAKATRSDGPLLKFLGLKQLELKRAREIEDIIQFVFRGICRCADFDGDYTVYLYSKDQAEALAGYLTENGLADYELIPVEEAGLMDLERPHSGRKAEKLDERGLAERKEANRASDAARQKKKRDEENVLKELAGTRRKPGRPRKTPSQPQAGL